MSVAFSATGSIRSIASRSQTARAAFSTSSAALSRREVLVQLTSDVDNLGYTGDRVLVSPGRARNQLIPGRVARFVPWKKASDKEPRIVPRSEVAARASTSTAASALAVRTALSTLPGRITFSHRTTSPKASTMFGSVTLADVTRRLEEEHGLPNSSVQVSWVGQDDSTRIKSLGRYDVDVRYAGSEPAPALGSVEAQALADAGPGRATVTVEVEREA